LLDTAGVALKFERDGGMLPPEIETALAMIVREAAMNIQRHSAAHNAKIEVTTEAVAAEAGDKAGEKSVLLCVSDDGRGGVTTNGNGLSGIGERVRSLAGTLEIESPRGKGTTLRVRLPLTGSAATASARSVAPAAAAESGAAEREQQAALAGDAERAAPQAAGAELESMSGALRT
jgi:two-component system, NarL family, sensor histidine kinase DesK